RKDPRGPLLTDGYSPFGASRGPRALPKILRSATSWLAPATAEEEASVDPVPWVNPVRQASEEVSPPATRLQKPVSSSDRCPGPWRARRRQGSTELTTDILIPASSVAAPRSIL